MQKRRYIVTGGGGFVGRAIALRLASQGHEVAVVSRSTYPELAVAGIRSYAVNLADDTRKLAALLQGVDAVFHAAAKVDMWGAYQAFFDTNVLGTRAVLGACREAGVRKLVFTSSPSVVAGDEELAGVDESHPYPERHLASYPATKAQAEREVLAANHPETLRTIALRPHLIFGPGDNHLLPTIIERARAGRLLRVGNGKNLSDFTYIDDCVEAHLLALKALDSNPEAWGKAYFISQGDPVPLWWWVDEALKLNGLPPVRRSVPATVAATLAALMEGICGLLPRRPEPLFTRFLVHEMASNHYFDISAARRDLGFRPSRTVREALQQLTLKQAA